MTGSTACHISRVCRITVLLLVSSGKASPEQITFKTASASTTAAALAAAMPRPGICLASVLSGLLPPCGVLVVHQRACGTARIAGNARLADVGSAERGAALLLPVLQRLAECGREPRPRASLPACGEHSQSVAPDRPWIDLPVSLPPVVRTEDEKLPISGLSAVWLVWLAASRRRL